MRGHYHRNVAVDVPGGRVLVRVPLAGTDPMDLRIWPEAQILAAVSPFVRRAPRLWYASAEPVFQLQQFVDGVLLDDVAPVGTPVPEGVADGLVDFFRSLRAVPRDVLPTLPAGWPDDGDCAGFGARLADLTRTVWRRHLADYGPLWTAVGVPTDPLEAARERLADLSPRGFSLLHADVHRQNVIVGDAGPVVIDWELALYGDPSYDIAGHLYKTAYLPAEEAAVLGAWPEFAADIDRYLAHERVKSAIVDTVRLSRLYRKSPDPALVDKLCRLLDAAYRVWGVAGPADAQRVRWAITR